MRKPFLKKDDLDLNIDNILEIMLEKSPSVDGTDLKYTDLLDMAHFMPAFDVQLYGEELIFPRTTEA